MANTAEKKLLIEERFMNLVPSTTETQQILRRAREEAIQLGHANLDAVHILLATQRGRDADATRHRLQTENFGLAKPSSADTEHVSIRDLLSNLTDLSARRRKYGLPDEITPGDILIDLPSMEGTIRRFTSPGSLLPTEQNFLF